MYDEDNRGISYGEGQEGDFPGGGGAESEEGV